MNQFILLIFILVSFSARAQQSLYGVDSLRNIHWELKVRADGDSGYYDYTRIEYYLNNIRALSCLQCKDSSLIMGRKSYPSGLTKKVKTDPRAKSKYGPLPDSSLVLDNERVEQYLRENKIEIDTIFVKSSKTLGSDVWDRLSISGKCSYRYSTKHGYERVYYKVEEVKGVCITDNFLIKYEGYWRYGKKNGKWKEYDKTGRLIALRKYDNGKLIKETIFSS